MNVHSRIFNIVILEPATKQQLWEIYTGTKFVNAFHTLEEAIAYRNDLLQAS